MEAKHVATLDLAGFASFLVEDSDLSKALAQMGRAIDYASLPSGLKSDLPLVLMRAHDATTPILAVFMRINVGKTKQVTSV